MFIQKSVSHLFVGQQCSVASWLMAWRLGQACVVDDHYHLVFQLVGQVYLSQY